MIFSFAALAPLAFRIGKAALGFAQNQASEKTRRLEIDAGVDIEKIRADVALAGVAASVVKTGMAHKCFWIPWLMAAVPLEAWFGWGMLDTLFNGALPDVAVIPEQLEIYADVVHRNIFYSGAAGLGVSTLDRALRRKR